MTSVVIPSLLSEPSKSAERWLNALSRDGEVSAEELEVRDLYHARARLLRLGLTEDAAGLNDRVATARSRRDAALLASIDDEHERIKKALVERHKSRKVASEHLQLRAANRRKETAGIIFAHHKNHEALAVINSIAMLRPSGDLEKSELAELLEPASYAEGGELIVEGESEAPGELIFVAKGIVEIKVKGRRVAELVAPFYVGEGRLLSTGEAASASVVAFKGGVEAFLLSQANFDTLTHSPNMRFILPTMKREIDIRDFERVTRASKDSLWTQLNHDATFLAHVRLHAITLNLEAHLLFFEQVQALKRMQEGENDKVGADGIEKKLVKLLDLHETVLCDRPKVKMELLKLLEQFSSKSRSNRPSTADKPSSTSSSSSSSKNNHIYKALTATSERAIVETIIPNFEASGAYRKFLEELFPMPTSLRKNSAVILTGKDSLSLSSSSQITRNK